MQRCCHIVYLALWLLLLLLLGALNSGMSHFIEFWRLRGHGTDRLASESLLISGGNASVINARPGTTAEVGLGQIPQLFETREQFPHSLAQAHE